VRKDTFIAETDCYILRYDKFTFERILAEYPEIREEIEDIANSREKIRQNVDNMRTLAEDDSAKDQIIGILQQINKATE
jgi:CRP-like cAMP-binding protein